MMNYHEIVKEFSFCYGHRVWSQVLDCEYSIDNACKCRHLHGHEGLIKIYLQSETLNQGMVTDFKHLNWFKKWVDDVIDHKFIMDINDPLLPHEVYHLYEGNSELRMDMLLKNNQYHYWTLNLNNSHLSEIFMYSPSLYEKYEGMVFVDFIPTSENISKWIHQIVQNKMKGLGIKVSRVQFYETPKSQANYYST